LVLIHIHPKIISHILSKILIVIGVSATTPNSFD